MDVRALTDELRLLRTAKIVWSWRPKVWRQALRGMSVRRRWQTGWFTEESAYKP